MTLPGDTEAGHVGPPIASVYVKLVDVPDMNYFAANNVGEVSVIDEIVWLSSQSVVRCVLKVPLCPLDI